MLSVFLLYVIFYVISHFDFLICFTAKDPFYLAVIKVRRVKIVVEQVDLLFLNKVSDSR